MLFNVALHVRAWIEISCEFANWAGSVVALHVRAWVEILSLRSASCSGTVALHVRAWVEISRDFDLL